MSLGFRSFFWGLMLFYLGLIHEEQTRLPSRSKWEFFFPFLCISTTMLLWNKKSSLLKDWHRGPWVCTLSLYKQNSKQKQIVFFFFFFFTLLISLWSGITMVFSLVASEKLPSFCPSFFPSVFPWSVKGAFWNSFHDCVSPFLSCFPITLLRLYQIKSIKILPWKQRETRYYLK